MGLAQAREAVLKLSNRGIGWIEEPIAADSSPADWAELAKLSVSPLAGGENVSGIEAFQDMIRRGSREVIQPDLLKWGGVSGCHPVAREAVSQGLSYCPHWLGSVVGLVASAQVLAAVGGPGLLEHDVMDNPLREALTDDFPRVREGTFPLPTGPGIGFTPRLEHAELWLLAKNSFHL